MKKSWMTACMAAAAGVFFFCGCQNTVNTVGNEPQDPQVSNVRDQRIITDKFLRDRLAIQSVKMAPAASGNMTAEITATNVRTNALSQTWSWMTGENPYSVDYKFVWKDENGMAVETNLSTWRTIRINPGETVFLKSVAPNSRCRDFVLNLKESN